MPLPGSSAAQAFNWGDPVAGDEFNGTGVDTSKWRVYNGSGSNDNGLRLPQQVTESGGFLTITGLPNSGSGGMAWRFGQKYGRWEAQMRVTQQTVGGKPYHPVLLLWPDSNRWPQDGELDYAESDANAPSVNAFLHFPGNSATGQLWYNKPIDLSQWHDYAFEWSPGHMTGYIDGVQWYSTTDPRVQPPGPMHATIQLDDLVSPGGMNTTEMQVDWFRMYTV
ncbi:MAG TPA: glycoside hydrolase family 16 protein [Pseudonocardiaceae bacterium]|nr:glycoside hydrolase family 16 protein [Pseudonocardiaceae bacterium]